MTYEEFAAEIMRTGVLSDPWVDDGERFRLQGVLLSRTRAAALAQAAEAMTRALDELVAVVWQRPALLDDYFHLTPYQKLMWLAARGAWHGIARADLFETEGGGIACCEVNSDTPSGEAEAILVNRVLHASHGDVRDPNTELGDRFVAMLRVARGERPLRHIGMVYPTEITEDLSMIAIYREWLQGAGFEVHLGSPINLGHDGDRLTLMGAPVDLVLRHYKTDWWGEREPVRFDADPIPDPVPLHDPLMGVLQACESEGLTVVNPFGSVITQNKLAYAFLHEHRHLFSDEVQGTIDRYLPETRRLTTITPEQLIAERNDWVLKSDYGCEGDETHVGCFTPEHEWQQVVEMAIPHRWVAQRFFRVAPDESGALPNIGVFVIGGQAAGFYTRLSRGATTDMALTAPTYIQPGAYA